MKRTEPSRPLIGAKTARYVPADRTDIRKTFAKHRRLHSMQAAWKRSENNEANYPKEST